MGRRTAPLRRNWPSAAACGNGEVPHSAIANGTVDEVDRIYEELDTKTQELDTKTQELDTKAQELDTKTQELDTKTQELDTKTQELDTKTQELDTKTQELTSVRSELVLRGWVSWLTSPSCCLKKTRTSCCGVSRRKQSWV